MSVNRDACKDLKREYLHMFACLGVGCAYTCEWACE